MPSRLEDVYKSQPDPIHPSKTKLLDFKSLQEVPDSYKWTQLEDTPLSPVAKNVSESVPVIDLSDPNAINTIAQVCKTWGVFQVINHGVPLTLLDDIEFVSDTLFSLPPHQKLKAERPPDGICGYGRAKISHFFSKFMWSECFTIVGSPLEHFRLLWPQDHAKFCNTIEEYQREMQKLAAKLMWLMLSPLGITMEDLKWAGPNGDFKDSYAALQLNYYPACPDPDKAMGLAAHTDSTLLTVLQQNSTSGLQVLKEGTGWVTVAPIPGALIINIGDLLHILSNGLYSSVRHRALVNRTKTRLSMAYLYGPPSNVAISPSEKLVGSNQPALYRPVTWPEYLSTKAKLFNEALSSLRI
ncbi:2-oxoglutarate (2OG) and Fe(II)-dependent oxygenase superfamily protein [Euphorbia peplus]|nr:2-oxoglutarate (2OG) and Fe(II)-dependent oxygenase superfamily protein [Euphorbia peplus]